MGDWIYQGKNEPPPHQHDYPRYTDHHKDVRVGDQWLCSCGTVFEVESIQQFPDGEGISWN